MAAVDIDRTEASINLERHSQHAAGNSVSESVDTEKKSSSNSSSQQTSAGEWVSEGGRTEGGGREGESPHILSALSGRRAVRSRGPAPP